MSRISIKDMDKAAVLAALFNASRPQGMGFMRYNAEPMTVETARAILEKQTYFDYLQGRVMKVDLEGDDLDPTWYDRDNGPGAAQQAIDTIRVTGDVNDVVIRAQHVSGTMAAADLTEEHLLDPDTSHVQNGVKVFGMGFGPNAGPLAARIAEVRASTKSPLE